MKAILILICLIFFTIEFFSQAPLQQWQKCYGGSKDEVSKSIINTNDGGYIVVGGATSNDGDVSNWHPGYNNDSVEYYDYWVVKITNNGMLEWQNCYGGSGDDIANTVVQTTDGGYLVAGYTTSSDGDVNVFYDLADIWLIKLDSLGNIEWQKTYGDNNVSIAYSIVEIDTGGYMIAGSYGGPVNTNDVWLIKIDSIGNIIWDRKYGGTYEENVSSIKQTNDKGFIFTGVASSDDGDVIGWTPGGLPGLYTKDVWVVKIDSIGDIQWQSCVGTYESEAGYSVELEPDGSYIVAGSIVLNNSYTYSSNYLFVKYDSLGNIIWEKHYGGLNADIACSIKNTNGNGYIITGYSSSDAVDLFDSSYYAEETDNNGYYDILMIRTDSLGEILWQKCFGGSSEETSPIMIFANDSNYIVASYTNSSDCDVTGWHYGWYEGTTPPITSRFTYDFWVYKLQPDYAEIQKINALDYSIILYPNPAYNKIWINTNKFIKMDIMNSCGYFISSTEKDFIDISNQPAGIYIIRVFKEKEVIIKKIIKI